MCNNDIFPNGDGLDLLSEAAENGLESAVLETPEKSVELNTAEISTPLEDIDSSDKMITVLGLSEDEQDIYLAISTEDFAEDTTEMATDMTVDIPGKTPEIGETDGIEIDENLNRDTSSYTAGQCAKISTGTQNYCPFAGSGR